MTSEETDLDAIETPFAESDGDYLDYVEKKLTEERQRRGQKDEPDPDPPKRKIPQLSSNPTFEEFGAWKKRILSSDD